MDKLRNALAITGFFILGLSSLIYAQESVTITTYYPSPYGSYNELTTASNTYLATGGGNVGIGTTGPNTKLDVRGDLIIYGTTAGYTESMNSFYTGSAATGGGLNIHLGAAGAAPSSSTLKGYLRGRGTNNNIILGRYYSPSDETISMEVSNANGDIYLAQSKGNVGIGTTSPSDLLTVNGGNILVNGASASDAILRINTLPNGTAKKSQLALCNGYGAGGSCYGYFEFDNQLNTYSVYQAYASGYLGFGAGSRKSDMVILATNGNVGIGLASPQGKLHLHNSGVTQDVRLILTDGTTGSGSTAGVALIKGAAEDAYVWNYSAASLQLATNNSTRVYIKSDGKVGISNNSPGYLLTMESSGGGYYDSTDHAWHNASSIRWKKDIKPVTDALQTIDQLQGVYFKWKPEYGGKADIGFIAEDVAKVLPEVVSPDKEAPGYASGMDYAKLTALLTEGIKQLKKENETLKAEFEKRISALEAKMQNK